MRFVRGGLARVVAWAWKHGMKSGPSNKALESELAGLLAPRFSGIRAEVGKSDHWNRPCVTFRWTGFAGLLPEERFHRLVAVLPAEIRENRLAGFVWLELADDENVDAFLKLPRSEDIVDREAEIYTELVKARLFDLLADAMSGSPEQKCTGDFREMIRLLTAKRFPPKRVSDAKLLMIRHHAFCDCQILQTARGELAELFADAA
jgi:hypothetical protein